MPAIAAPASLRVPIDFVRSLAPALMLLKKFPDASYDVANANFMEFMAAFVL